MPERMNKSLSTAHIVDLAKNQIRKCKKVQMDNIIFPKWDELGLLGMIFRQNVRTKEQPDGCIYDEATYQVVMRIISGKVFMTGGRPDAYTWKHSKVANSKNVKLIGTNSAEALINLSTAITSINNEKEKRLFADMFCNLNKDLLLITSPEENRFCIEITQELFDKGITACVDEWMETDDNGYADATNLYVGDYLIVSSDNNSLYCIRHDEFLETHILL